MILEAAKSIAAATSALVKAASAAQRELIDLGKVNYLLRMNECFNCEQQLIKTYYSSQYTYDLYILLILSYKFTVGFTTKC